jgi:hypothetical protein
LDLEWLATDADGHLAVLTVVDGRPMPESFRDTAILDQIWDFIRALPVRCEANSW